MYLYKYLNPDRVDVLKQRRIRFTQPSALNDPFEFKPLFARIIDPTHVLDHFAANPIDITDTVEDGYGKLPEDLKAQVSLAEFKTYMVQALQNSDVQRDAVRYLHELANDLDAQLPYVESRIHEALEKNIGTALSANLGETRNE